MNTLFSLNRSKQAFLALLLGIAFFSTTAVQAHAMTTAEHFARMETQLNQALATLAEVVQSFKNGEVLGVSTQAISPSSEVQLAALKLQLQTLMTKQKNLVAEREKISQQISLADTEILKIQILIDQIVNPPVVKPTPRFNGFSAPGTPQVTVSAVFAAPKKATSVTGPVVLGKINWGDVTESENVSALVTGAQMTIDLKHTYKTAGTFTITLTDLNGKTVAQKVTVKAPVGKAPVCDAFTASPSALPVAGGNVTLTWATTNATNVSIDNSVGTVSVDGSKVINVLNTKTFVLVASNATGATVKCSVTVTIAPPVVTEPLLDIVSTSETLRENRPEITTDDVGDFVIKFEITANDADVFVPITAVRGVANRTAGVNFKVLNGSGIEVTTGVVTQLLSSEASRNGNYYVVNESEIETFTLTVRFDPATTGFYNVGLVNLNWNDTAAVPDIRTNFMPLTDFETDPLSI